MTLNRQTNRGCAMCLARPTKNVGSLLLSCILMSLLSACVGTTPHTQYRTHLPNPSVSGDPLGSFVTLTNLADAAFTNRLDNRMVENYGEFLFSVVEFDDQGKFWDKRQLDALHQVAQDDVARNNGAVLVTFVHGWDENAEVNNGTVWAFRRLLYQLYKVETNIDVTTGPPRRIIGVYVGWRGRSQWLPIVKGLTFWNRKTTAHKIGRSDMDELLAHLNHLKNRVSLVKPSGRMRTTRLVIVGHSFGAAMVFSAVDNILKEITFRNLLPVEDGSLKGLGTIRADAADLVVLINPAFEGLLYSGLADATATFTNFHHHQTTVLMTIGAENDQATGFLFPLGQFFPSLVQNFKPNSHERELTLHSLGHSTSYFTHYLSASAITNGVRETSAEHKREAPKTSSQRKGEAFQLTPWQQPEPVMNAMDWMQFAPPNRKWQLEPWPKGAVRPGNSPFMVVTASSQVVNNHGGIWGNTLIEFLRDFIAAQDHLRYHYDSSPATQPEQAGNTK